MSRVTPYLPASVAAALRLGIAGLCLFIIGCARPAPAPTPSPGRPKPYTVHGRRYQPLPHASGFSERGRASWYGKKFHGRKTANGETYDMYGISAAHKTLPLGTWVRVDNLDNGRRLDVRINDRGPFVRGRIIDLSYGAARKLGVVGPGTARVKIVALGRRKAAAGTRDKTPRYEAVDYQHGNFTFQVGAFQDPANAKRLQTELHAIYRNAHLATYYHAELGRLHAVRVGRAKTLEEAGKYKEFLRRNGFEGAFTVAE